MKKTTTSALFAAMLVMVTLFSCSTGPEGVAKKFLAAQESKDFKTMKELSTKESEQMIGMIEGLSAKDTSKAKGTPLTIKSTVVNGDTTALITYCCDAGAKDGADSKLHMKKTKDGWKVDMSKETLMGGKNLMDMMKDDKAPATGTDSTATAPAATTDTSKH